MSDWSKDNVTTWLKYYDLFVAEGGQPCRGGWRHGGGGVGHGNHPATACDKETTD